MLGTSLSQPFECSLTAEALFEGGVPLTVRDQTTLAPTGPVTVEAVKVVFGISGWARIESRGNNPVFLEPGTILTIPAGVTCVGHPHGHTRTVTFYVHTDYLAHELRWLPRMHPLMHHLQRSLDGATSLSGLRLPQSTMHELGSRLGHLAQMKAKQVSEFAMLSGASAVIDLVGRASGLEGMTPIEDSVRIPRREVAAAIALLRQEPDRPWDVEELAHRVALSSSQLTRTFRQETGTSPSAYLRQVRVEKMAELLTAQRLAVREAARAAGWNSTVVASRAFKRRYGVSPRDFARVAVRGASSALPTPHVREARSG